MTITNPQSYIKDTGQWIHSTFIVSLGEDYKTYVQIIEHNCKDEQYGDGLNPSLEPHMAQVIAEAQGGNIQGPLPVYFSHRKCRDTSLGGNDAINCYYQYNETDDPAHPFTMSETSASSGMGRVYSEVIDDHQQILYITFGLPVFNNLANFYKEALDAKVADFVNSGGGTTVLAKLQAMASTAISTMVKLPALPIMYIQAALHHAVNVRITKYYDFADKMALYYKYVQAILTTLSVNMGFMNDANLLQQNPSLNGTGGTISDQTPAEQAQATAAESGTPGIPDMFRTYNMDIQQILQRRRTFMQGYNSSDIPKTTDQTVLDMAQEAKNGATGLTHYDITMTNPLNSLSDLFWNSIYNPQLYIGFRVEKTTDSSESFSNQIGPSEIASFINSKQQAAREAKFKAMYGKTGLAIPDAISEFLGGLANHLANMSKNAKGIEGLTQLATGSGMIDIPEIWKDSTAAKNYDFRMTLYSPYGDPLSVMQSLYVPLAMILAGSLPRATGNTSYTTPFICRAYCKGMFAVPLGMIENVSIKRGRDTNGWTFQRLPTTIEINFSIKDLSPCMYMAMGDLSGELLDTWNVAFGNNSSFQEYMMTLSGMGLMERTIWLLQAKRNVQIMLRTIYDLKLNPNYWLMEFSSTLPARLISKIIPNTRYTPQN